MDIIKFQDLKIEMIRLHNNMPNGTREINIQKLK